MASSARRRNYNIVNLMRVALAATPVFAMASHGPQYLFGVAVVLEVVCVTWFFVAAFFLTEDVQEGPLSYFISGADVLALTFFVHFAGGGVSFVMLGYSGLTALSSMNTRVRQGLLSALLGACAYASLQILYGAELLAPLNVVGAVHQASLVEAAWACSGILIINLTVYWVIHGLVLSLRENNALLLALSLRDPLTGLPNRRALEQRAREEILRGARHARPLSLVVADVDFFKRLNDAEGHEVGDSRLNEVAQILRTHFRRAGDFVARVGGEEFVLLLPETDEAGCAHHLESLQRRFAEQPLHHPDSPIAPFVTISAGAITAMPTPETSFAELFRCADQALYSAKRRGRNTFVQWTPELAAGLPVGGALERPTVSYSGA